jgi:phosphopantetheinyl transferase
MPFIYQHQINQSSRVGVWHIAEGEDFFLPRVPLQRSITHPHKRLQHLAGRLLLTELAPGFPHELVRIADTRRPFLPDESWHFSLSHCGDYAAAVVSQVQRVGVDVELVSEKVERVKGKFLAQGELAMLEGMRFDDRWPMTDERRQGGGDSGQMTDDRGQWADDGRQMAVDTGGLPPIALEGSKQQANFQLSTFHFPLLTACWSIKEALFKWLGTAGVDFREHLRIERLEIRGNQGRAHCRVLKDGEVELTAELLFFGEVCLSWVVG